MERIRFSQFSVNIIQHVSTAIGLDAAVQPTFCPIFFFTISIPWPQERAGVLVLQLEKRP